MLSNKPDSMAVDQKTTTVMHTPAPSPMQAVQELIDVLASPEFRDANSFEPEYLTSPLIDTPYSDFTTSPNDDSPWNDFLNTPVIQDDSDPLIVMGSGEYSHLALFAGMSGYDEHVTPATSFASLLSDAADKKSSVPQPPLHFMADNCKQQLYTPGTPPVESIVESVDPASLYPSPNMSSEQSFTPSPPPSRPTKLTATGPGSRPRRTVATGTRKNVTPETLVPIDAPTQPRKYALPSSTSRKEVPAIFLRKRKAAQAFEDDVDDNEQDELNEPLPPNASEREQIEWKRRQNTLAARKSRKRKLEHQRNLECRNERLEDGLEKYAMREEQLAILLQVNGIQVPDWERPDL